MKNIHILTGEIKSGKTTRLMLWASSQKNIDGILQPVIEEKRFIYHLGSKTLKQLETAEEPNAIQIGNYKFSGRVFSWSQNVIVSCLQKDLDWLVIDEIGPLELEGKGLEPAITQIFSERDNFRGNILCVVRNSILEKFIQHYRIENSYEIFNEV
ncbi:MAG: nucleoside-triphosphatase [Bacteroidetes bacterium]|nr:nucleoside-triphosphatase [Bacteroidota bacterium]